LEKSSWSDLRERLKEQLTEEERQIVDLLVAGTSTPDIAKKLGQHRSMIWRKIQRIRAYAP